MGYEGFSGNESILYHLTSPCDVAEVGEFTPIEHEEWVPDAHVHRLTDTAPLEPGGDPVFGRQVLMWNADVEMGDREADRGARRLLPQRRGRRGALRARGRRASSRRSSGRLPFRAHDYVVIPRGTTYRVRLGAGPHTWLTFHTPGEIETPNRYRNRYGQLLEHAPFSQRDFHPPAVARAAPRARRLRADRARARRPPAVRARPPPARRRRLGRLRLPVHVQHPRLRAQVRPAAPAAARAPDVPGPELRDLLVLPAQPRLGPARRAAALPPLEPAVGGGHLLRRRPVRVAARGGRRARSRCIRAACRTGRSPDSSRSRSARRAPRSWP